MRQLMAYLVGRLYRPILAKYLATERVYKYKGLVLQVPPEVFHPAFFFSTKLLLAYSSKLQLRGKTFLELGAGSGLIAMCAARQGAVVTATDINPVAVANLITNSKANNVQMQVVASNLFEALRPQEFDIIVVNPPYFKKAPRSNKDYAWYCGENGEFFYGFFSGLSQYIHQTSVVLMVLSDGCDIAMIKSMAATNGYQLNCVQQKQLVIEQDYIFSIQPQ